MCGSYRRFVVYQYRRDYESLLCTKSETGYCSVLAKYWRHVQRNAVVVDIGLGVEECIDFSGQLAEFPADEYPEYIPVCRDYVCLVHE